MYHVSAALLTLALGVTSYSAAAADNAWSRVQQPLPGAAQAIGFYTGGCMVGAQTLAPRGEGYQTMRRSRNRYYGQSQLLDLVRGIGYTAARMGQLALIGDLSQPRGGPMPSGHRSHQLGLDADIWLMPAPKAHLSARETEDLAAISMVNAIAGRAVRSQWGRYQRELLYFAATHPKVERIFINPVLKLELCRSETDHSWLNKVRPWWGHDAHFHVRMSCPPGSPLCETQKPIPVGDGCDADLEKWVEEQRQLALNPQKRKPSEPSATVLPVECNAVLSGALR